MSATAMAAARQLAACCGPEQMEALKDESWMAMQAACALAELGAVDALPERAWQVLEGNLAGAGGSVPSEAWVRLAAALGFGGSRAGPGARGACVVLGAALRGTLLAHIA